MGLFGGDSTTVVSTSNETNTQNATTDLNGAAGDKSPTVSSVNGAVTYNDSGGDVSLAALAGMSEVVAEALGQNASMINRQVDNYARQNDNSAEMLSNVLKANMTLSENKQTGTDTTSTRYYILGALALAAAFLFFNRK